MRPDGDDGAFDPPATQQMESALRSWDAGQERTAVLALRPERAEALRARGSATALPADADPALRAVVADRDLVRVPYRATWELAEEVAGYGDAVLVADPPALRAAVLRLLRSAAALAGPDAGAGPGTGRTDVAERASERLLRLLGMIGYLDRHDGVPVDQLAEHFGVSSSQVMADVDTLWMSGTPGYYPHDLIDFDADSYDRGEIRLTESRGMTQPLRLGTREAVTLLAALSAMVADLGPTLEPEHAAVLRSALDKLAAATGRRRTRWTCGWRSTGCRRWSPRSAPRSPGAAGCASAT